MDAVADAVALLKVVSRLDHRTAVMGACLAARSVAVLAGEDARLTEAVRLAEAWVDARASVRTCETASAAAHAAALARFAAGGRAAGNAAHAAGYAAGVSDRHDCARAAEAAATAAGNRAGPGWRQAARDHGVALAREIHTLRVPFVTRPDAAEVVRAVRGVQVAWDWVATTCAEPTLDVAALLAAHARAARLGLDWADPVQRAIAEHIADDAVDTVARLLRGMPK